MTVNELRQILATVEDGALSVTIYDVQFGLCCAVQAEVADDPLGGPRSFVLSAYSPHNNIQTGYSRLPRNYRPVGR